MFPCLTQFISTSHHQYNHHYISLQIKSFGQVRTQVNFPVPVFLGDKEPSVERLRDKKTRFLIKRSPSGQEPRFLELFSEIYVPEVRVNISAEDRAAVERWLQDANNSLAAPPTSAGTWSLEPLQMSSSDVLKNRNKKPGPVSSKKCNASLRSTAETNSTYLDTSDKSTSVQKLAPLVISNLNSEPVLNNSNSTYLCKKENRAMVKSKKTDKPRGSKMKSLKVVTNNTSAAPRKRGRPKKVEELSQYLRLIRISKVKSDRNEKEKYELCYSMPAARNTN